MGGVWSSTLQLKHSIRVVLDPVPLLIDSQLLIVVGLKLSSDGGVDGRSLGMWGSLEMSPRFHAR